MICQVAYLNRGKYDSLAVVRTVTTVKSPVDIFRASGPPYYIYIYIQEPLKFRPEGFHTFINFHTNMVSSGFF